jgi:hypothetical protein
MSEVEFAVGQKLRRKRDGGVIELTQRVSPNTWRWKTRLGLGGAVSEDLLRNKYEPIQEE